MNQGDIPAISQDAPVILEMNHISKSFGAVTALKDVSIYLRTGEVLALVGDNGAGKSTLIKILCGFHPQDSGTIEWEGKPLHLRSPLDARHHGIETVYQDLALVNDLTVYQNLFIGREKIIRLAGIFPLTDNRAMKRETREHLNRLGINLPSVSSLVRQLSGGQRQSIAVARSMH